MEMRESYDNLKFKIPFHSIESEIADVTSSALNDKKKYLTKIIIELIDKLNTNLPSCRFYSTLQAQ